MGRKANGKEKLPSDVNGGAREKSAQTQALDRRFGRLLPQSCLWAYVLPALFLLTFGGYRMGMLRAGLDAVGALPVQIDAVLGLLFGCGLLTDMFLCLHRARRCETIRRRMSAARTLPSEEDVRRLLRLERADKYPFFLWTLLPLILLFLLCRELFLEVGRGGTEGLLLPGFIACLISAAVLIFLLVCRAVQTALILLRVRLPLPASLPQTPDQPEAARTAKETAARAPLPPAPRRETASASAPKPTIRKEKKTAMEPTTPRASAAPQRRPQPLWHKTTAAASPTADASLSMGDVCGALRTASTVRGFALTEASARSLLAALAAGRLLILRAEEPSSLEAACGAVLCLADGRVCACGAEGGQGLVSDLLLRRDMSGAYLSSGLLCALEAAPAGGICPILLTRLPDADTEAGRLICRYAAAPTACGEPELPLPADRDAARLLSTLPGAPDASGKRISLQMPENLWFCVPSPSDGKLPDGMTDFALSVTLTGHAVTPDLQSAAAPLPDARTLARLTLAARRASYLPEEIWRCVDQLFVYLSRALGQTPDHRLLRRMEIYTSVYLAAGGSPEEALDASLECLLLPLLDAMPHGPLTASAGDPGLSGTLDALFGRGRLPRTFAALQRMGLSPL